MAKRTNGETESGYPIVSVQRFQPLKCEVNTCQLDELTRYIRYVESATGDKPTEGEVVGAALAELFKLDRGFQKWREQADKQDTGANKGPDISPTKTPIK
ncbi:MAG: hypothetical protein ACREDR_33925 [Blastocatellia bacterium]